MKDVRRVDYGETATAAKTCRAGYGFRGPADASPPMKITTIRRLAAVQSVTRVLPAGTAIPVRNEETIDSAKAVEGQIYAAEIASDVHDADRAVAHSARLQRATW